MNKQSVTNLLATFEKALATFRREVEESGVELPTPDLDSAELVAETEELVEEIVEITNGLDAPWVIEAYKWEGLNEVDDRDQLEPFLGMNPDDSDGGLAWCASFINSVMEAVEIIGTGSLLARSFMDWGTECECVDGALAVYEGHIGIVIGAGLLGGNQGDMVRLNKNRSWFDKNKKLLGFRCPPGYKFV